MKLHPFYLIVDSADWIERLVPLGVKLVQLRMKDCSEDDIRAHIRRSKAICADHGCQLIVNDYWQLAIELFAASLGDLVRTPATGDVTPKRCS